jgi:uncharacterized protein (DUF362 family)
MKEDVMSYKINNYNRREFIDHTVKGTIGLLTFPFILNSSNESKAASLAKSTVVVVKDETVLSSNRIDQKVVQVMVDAAIKKLTGIEDVGEAWKSFFPGIKQSSVISIKINCINRSLSSHPEVAYSISNGLTKMNVEGNSFFENNIIIWDRTNSELRSAGYTINTGSTGVRCFGTNQSGVGYSSTQFSVASSSQKISRILADMSDYMINLSVLKNHSTSGITASMKNHYGTCNNPGNLHGGYGDPYIPALNNLDSIRNKQVITICDAIYGIISGGPSGNPQVTPKSILMSKDPVAHDYIAAQMLKDYGCNTINRAAHIATAAKAPYSLGTNDPNQIDSIKIENPTTGVDTIPDDNRAPDDFQLFQNYPNPFNSETSLTYQLYKSARVRLDIYNIQGALARRLVDTHQSNGYYRISWDGNDSNGTALPSGTYFARFLINDIQQTIRIMLIN